MLLLLNYFLSESQPFQDKYRAGRVETVSPDKVKDDRKEKQAHRCKRILYGVRNRITGSQTRNAVNQSTPLCLLFPFPSVCFAYEFDGMLSQTPELVNQH